MAKHKFWAVVFSLPISLALLGGASSAQAQSVAGYAEYILPGDELNMYYIFNQLDANAASSNMHSVTSVTAWSPNTTIYFDHWENGYNFDPANPAATADEVYTIANAGGVLVFESNNVPNVGAPPAQRSAAAVVCTGQLNPLGAANGSRCYDGGDRIYVAGGAVTVTRAVWIDARGVGNQGDAWEVYPVKPQLTTYVVPFGEDLYATDPAYFTGFQRVYALIQATDDNTTFTVDLNHDGIPDTLNLNRDATWNNGGDGTTVTLQRGETFLLDQISACPGHATCTTAPGSLVTGAVITGNKTLQVKYVAGRTGATYAARGLSAFPRGYWTKDYYAPFGQATACNKGITDYYLHNPSSAPLTVSWQGLTTSGSFTIAANSTQSFNRAVGARPSVPVGSGLYFSANSPFWGVGFGDSTNSQTTCGLGTPTGQGYEWGFSLLPTSLLYKEHYFGWAPGSLPLNTAPANGNGAFLTAVQDNTTIFVDYNNDGTADQTYTLNRLQSQFIPPGATGDLKGARIWGTGEFTVAWGENPDNATTPTPNLDLGYVALPATDFVSLALLVSKSANPAVIGTASGSYSDFTIKADTSSYPLDSVSVVDTLPPNWQYVAGFTTITYPDLTTATGINPTISGAGTAASPYVLTWSAAQLGTTGMQANREVKIQFRAATTAVLTTGTLSQNRVVATGTRTVGAGPGAIQTFSATDFAFVTTGSAAITKTSNATTPLYPGDRFTYTVTLPNPGSAGTNLLTGISLYDGLPTGVASVAGTTTLSHSTVADSFSSQAYNLNVGTRNWSGNWTEAGDGGGGATGGDIQVTAAGELQLDNSASNEPTISRAVNLTGATTALLSFKYRTGSGVLATDHVYVQVGTAGVGGAFATLTGGDITGIAGATSGTRSFDISASISATTAIRFTFPNGSYQGANAFFYVDDLSITYNVAVAGPNPPEVISASSLYATTGGQTVTATFDVTVNDPFPAGQSSVTNTAATTSVQLPMQLTASRTDIVTKPASETASVAGRIWLDTNGDAAQSVGEPGIANVAVTLKDFFGTPVATGTTDSNGRFLFTGVAPGSGYYVEAASPSSPGGAPLAGLTQTFPSSTANYKTTSFNLAAGQQYSGADQGFKPVAGSAIFGDLAWMDSNSDGIRNPGEAGLGGVAVRLYRDANADGVLNPLVDTFVAAPLSGLGTVAVTSGSTAVTGTNTRFTSLAVGDPITIGGTAYTISAIASDTSLTLGAASGTTSTALPYVVTSTPGAGTVQITHGASVATVTGTGTAFGTLAPGDPIEIGGVAYRVQSVTDATHLTLTTNPATSAAGLTYGLAVPTTTDSDGSYLFTGVTPATGTQTYFVAAATPSGYTATTPTSFRFPNVASGSANLSADFGFNGGASTYTLTDRVWLDNGAGAGVASNGTQDGSEAGIPGVTVDLLDASLNVVATATTDATGSFTFTGLTGGGADYTTRITDTAGVLAGMFGTTSYSIAGSRSEPNLTASRSHLSPTLAPSYGFNATRSIGDTVWADLNANGVQDAGEPGIEGVTVSLYRDVNGNGAVNMAVSAGPGTVTTTAGSPNVVGTGTAFLNYHAGEPITIGGTTYRVLSVTDATHLTLTSNATANTGVTYTAPSAGAGTVTTTAGSTAVTGAGTAFTSFRAGDPITIGGVVYTIASVTDATHLTLTTTATANTNAAYWGLGDALLATVTTDANGHYLFSGLGDRGYVVSVQTPTGYTYVPSTRPDTDAATAGIQLAATIAGTGNVLDRDFGFQPTTARTLSGRVWNDTDASGTINGTETGISGVTIDILSGTTVVATVTTDSSGSYSVAGLCACSYTVRVTDTSGVLSSFVTSYEYGGTPFDGQATANLTSASLSGVNFGYYHSTPTRALVRSAKAVSFPGGVELSWRTGFEAENLGFRVHREEAGVRTLVSPSLVAGSALFAGRSVPLTSGRGYRWVDSRPAGPSVRYWVEDVDLDGTVRLTGPAFVEPAAAGPEMGGSAPLLRALGAGETDRTGGGLGATPVDGIVPTRRGDRQLQFSLAAGPAAKIGVVEEGWYRVTKTQLVAAGFDPSSDPETLQLFADGVEQAIVVEAGASGRFDAEGAVQFYGTGLDTPSTNARTYWLVAGRSRGLRVETVKPSPGPAPEPASFPFTVERKDRTVYFAALTNNGDAENFFGPVVSSSPLPLSLDLPFLDSSASGTARLEVALQGVTTGTAHRVEVSVASHLAGSVSFEGQSRGTAAFDVPVSWLAAGTNTLSLAAVGGELDHSLVDTLRVTYPRRFVADGGALALPAPLSSVWVGGFGMAGARVVDVSDPARPAEFASVESRSAAAGGWEARIDAAGSGATRLLAFTPDRVRTPASIAVNVPSEWNAAATRADLVVIGPKALLSPVEPLVAARQREGLAVAVVDVADVYDEFSFGEKSPAAIRDFMSWAGRTWAVRPSYLLLVGDASSDPKNHLGLGDADLVPTTLVATRYLKTASDDAFVDPSGTGVPPVAVGRLPVRTAEEASLVVGKILSRQGAAAADPWTRRVLFVGDALNGFDFDGEAREFAALVPGGWEVQQLSVDTLGDGSRGALLDSLNAGSGIVTLIGHGSEATFGGHTLIEGKDALGLRNGSRLPFLVSMDCLNGLFHDPFGDSLAESFLKAPSGGAVAAWASSALTEPAPQGRMARRLFESLFSAEAPRLGDAARAAKAGTEDPDVRRSWILFGDPTMKLR